MKITIHSEGYRIVARDEKGTLLATRRTACNPTALRQLMSDAESLGEIDWGNSPVARPEKST